MLGECGQVSALMPSRFKVVATTALSVLSASRTRTGP
jgi:hypothetical protein